MNIRPFTLSQEELKREVSYDAETGVFTWVRVNPAYRKAKAGDVAGSKNTSGYWMLRLAGDYWLAHRIAWFYVHGAWPESLVDHKNRNKLDNRIDNLRVATIGENRQNMTEYASNTSGYKGVHWFKHTKKWMAAISHGGKRHHLGCFTHLEDAAAAYAAAASRFHKYNPASTDARR